MLLFYKLKAPRGDYNNINLSCFDVHKSIEKN